MIYTPSNRTFYDGRFGANTIHYTRFSRKPAYEEGLFGFHEQPFTF